MDEQESTFDWLPLGQQWWADAGATLGATAKQIKFAAAKHRGASNTGAARAADYGDDSDGIRQVAYRVVRSNRVQELLALAQAETRGEVRGPMDNGQMRRELERMAYGADPNTKIRAIEALQRLDARVIELGSAPDLDGFGPWWTLRDILCAPNGAAAVLLLWVGQGSGLDSIPFLHDVAANAQRQEPELWARHIERLSAHSWAELNALLGNPKWQLVERRKLWGEIGVDVELGRAVDTSALRDDEERAAAMPAGAEDKHAAAAGFKPQLINGGTNGAHARK
jgi:hypothetical protein